MTAEFALHFKNLSEKIGIPQLDGETFEKLLTQHLERYVPLLERKELRHHMIAFVKGLLSDLERKSIEPIGLTFETISDVRNLANFMTRSVFNDQAILLEHQKELAGLLSHPDGMITADGWDFPKKGRNSVGVARQYSIRLGRTDNFQASVMVGYVGPGGYGLADAGLYMPEKWFSDEHAPLRRQCRVPENLEFTPKNIILSNLIKKLVHSGNFKAKYIGIDSTFGSDREFLESLPPGLIYFADIPACYELFPQYQEMNASKSGRKNKSVSVSLSVSPQSVKQMAADSDVPWGEAVLGVGAKGPVIFKDKCIKAAEISNNKPGKDIWLYVRQSPEGSVVYSICNQSMEATPDMIRGPAALRWSISQCFPECHEYLGMGHCEARAWPAWRRHILFTFMAHFFILKMRHRFGVKINFPVLPGIAGNAGTDSDGL